MLNNSSIDSLGSVQHKITNMRTTFLISLFTLGIFTIGLAQPDGKTKLDWGQELSKPSNTFLSKIITSNETGIYALRERTKQQGFDGPSKIYLEHYTPQMKLRKSVKLDMKYHKKRVEFESIIPFGGKMYLFTSFNNEAKKINYLFAQEVDYRRLTPSKKLTKVAENPTKNRAAEGYFDFSISKDSSKLLIYNQNPELRKTQETFSIYVYDQEMNPLWEKEITLPYPDQNVNIESFEIDNDGNVYILNTVFDKGAKEIKRGRSNYRYSILAYSASGEKIVEYPLELENYFITDLTFKIANDGHLVFAGFYSQKGTASARGTYFFRLNPITEEVYANNTKEFDFDLLTADLSNRKRSRAEKAEQSGDVNKQAELRSFSLDHLILRNDGGAVLVGEQYYVDVVNSFDNFVGGRFGGAGGNRVDYYYHYNDLIVANIRPNGEIDWATRIPKEQETRNDGGYFSSYAMSIVRDKLFFIFNDDSRNYDRDDDRLYGFSGNSKRTLISLAQINRDGSLEMSPLINNEQDNLLFRPKVSRQTGKREMILFGERGKKFKLATLQFLE